MAEAIKEDTQTWLKAAPADKFPMDGGACVKLEGEQIAVFNFTTKGEWFACQNECPHKKQMAISRGMIGTKSETPKVACPFHKKNFSLEDGTCMDDDSCGSLKTYPVKVEDGIVYIGMD